MNAHIYGYGVVGAEIDAGDVTEVSVIMVSTSLNKNRSHFATLFLLHESQEIYDYSSSSDIRWKTGLRMDGRFYEVSAV